MFGWECDPARDGRLTIAEYRKQFSGKLGHQATISGHMGSKRGTAANLAKVRCTLAQVFDSFAIFTVNDGRHTQPAGTPPDPVRRFRLGPFRRYRSRMAIGGTRPRCRRTERKRP